jgi:hypothetical protein
MDWRDWMRDSTLTSLSGCDAPEQTTFLCQSNPTDCGQEANGVGLSFNWLRRLL